MTAPQKCPDCRESLADPNVPAKYRKYRRQFTIALWYEDDKQWECPRCGHRWTPNQT